MSKICESQAVGIWCNHTAACFARVCTCINRHIWRVHMYKDLCCFEGNWRDTVSTGTPNSTRTLRAYCTNVRRVQKLKCNVVSHASKHKPDSHILPYWSDRICRKLAENTNTAWGDCLKLETSFLCTVFSCSGNHLAVHAYQAFFLETWIRVPAFFRLRCLLPWLLMNHAAEISS